MSFAMTDALVRDHLRDVKLQADRCRGRSPRSGQVQGASRSADPRYPLTRLPRLRRQVGLRLVEAGLHLMAADPQPRG